MDIQQLLSNVTQAKRDVIYLEEGRLLGACTRWGTAGLKVDLGYEALPFHFNALLTQNCEGKSKRFNHV